MACLRRRLPPCSVRPDTRVRKRPRGRALHLDCTGASDAEGAARKRVCVLSNGLSRRKVGSTSVTSVTHKISDRTHCTVQRALVLYAQIRSTDRVLRVQSPSSIRVLITSMQGLSDRICNNTQHRISLSGNHTAGRCKVVDAGGRGPCHRRLRSQATKRIPLAARRAIRAMPANMCAYM